MFDQHQMHMDHDGDVVLVLMQAKAESQGLPRPLESLYSTLISAMVIGIIT
jgi:hypothetical protein